MNYLMMRKCMFWLSTIIEQIICKFNYLITVCMGVLCSSSVGSIGLTYVDSSNWSIVLSRRSKIASHTWQWVLILGKDPSNLFQVAFCLCDCDRVAFQEGSPGSSHTYTAYPWPMLAIAGTLFILQCPSSAICRENLILCSLYRRNT